MKWVNQMINLAVYLVGHVIMLLIRLTRELLLWGERRIGLMAMGQGPNTAAEWVIDLLLWTIVLLLIKQIW